MKNSELLSHTDYNLYFDTNEVDETPIEVLNIGLVNFPSGQVVVCDPLAIPDMPPLTLSIKPGKYPVKIYTAKTKDSGDRYAIAKLEIENTKATKWVLALREGEDVSELKEPGDFFGFPVDAGLGGFFDYQTGKEYSQFIDKFFLDNPELNIYDDFFATEFKKNADPNDESDFGNWINFTLPGTTDKNITMFQSGYGDGVYPAYWGMTSDNKIVSLVIDFHVLLLPDAE